MSDFIPDFFNTDLESYTVGHFVWIGFMIYAVYSMYKIALILRKYNKLRKIKIKAARNLKKKFEKYYKDHCVEEHTKLIEEELASMQNKLLQDSDSSGTDEEHSMLLPDTSGRLVYKVPFKDSDYYEALQQYHKELKEGKVTLEDITESGEND